MKKCRTMRLASLLLVCVLLSTCIISGTFAKYTVSSTGTDTARIAKWGISMPATLSIDLFDGTYDSGKVVATPSTVNVVAPGTTKTATVTLATVTGTAPEVMYNYNVALSYNSSDTGAAATIAALDALNGFKWTLKAPGATSATEYATFAALQTAVNALSQTNIAANTLPTGFATGENNKMDIGWKWDFATASATDVDDPADTLAGNSAAAGTLTAFTLTLSISATQVD